MHVYGCMGVTAMVWSTPTMAMAVAIVMTTTMMLMMHVNLFHFVHTHAHTLFIRIRCFIHDLTRTNQHTHTQLPSLSRYTTAWHTAMSTKAAQTAQIIDIATAVATVPPKTKLTTATTAQQRMVALVNIFQLF